MKTWDSVAIVGCGLIGGSIGLALLRRGLAKEVVGIGRRPETLQAAQEQGAVTRTTTDLTEGVAAAELIVVCTPVGDIVGHVTQAAAVCAPSALITDAGSIKGEIVSMVEEASRHESWQPGVRFVGSHPLAGNEKKGPRHSRADLFQDRVVVVTPTDRTAPADCEIVANFWTSLGARVVEMPAAHHDRIVAATSHMPHLVAAAIAAATPEEYVTLTAGGWLDSTRIAAGDPALWRQIMLANRQNLLVSLGRFENALGALRAAIEQHDQVALEKLLAEARRVRDALGS